ncbi:hypothetical protein F5Y15DRAFT_429526 [Xylariaceae sp. FL0016]|nr:hypothetical protein F5Y15DRAFT_429526 [Xylariaceae sp. FL0016]
MDRCKKGAAKSTGDSGVDTYDKTKEQAVKHETVKPTQREEATTVVDRDTHQDHYKHTVQPVYQDSTEPTKHTQARAATQHREIDERDDGAMRKMRGEKAKYKNEKEVEGTKYEKRQMPTEVTENLHHHMHETVQPVIHETVHQPEVVHTTEPIHETHHKADQMHGTTTMPGISMKEFMEGKGEVKGAREGGIEAHKAGGMESGKTSHKRADSGKGMDDSGDSFGSSYYASQDDLMKKDEMMKERGERTTYPTLTSKLPSLKDLNPLVDSSKDE